MQEHIVTNMQEQQLQLICVCWQSSISNSFSIGNGTQQGVYFLPLYSVATSVTFCRRFQLQMLAAILVFINVLTYADDIVLLAPFWNALQQLLSVLEMHIDDIDMTCNVKKTVCVIFEPKQRSRKMSVSCPQFKFKLL